MKMLTFPVIRIICQFKNHHGAHTSKKEEYVQKKNQQGSLQNNMPLPRNIADPTQNDFLNLRARTTQLLSNAKEDWVIENKKDGI